MRGVEERLVEAVKRFATQVLGFDLVGIAPAAPPPTAEHLSTWLARGHHATMGYLARTAAVRADPRRLLPGARAVICVAVSYHDPFDAGELCPSPEFALVARYARRCDYHQLLRRRLLRLGAWLVAHRPGSTVRAAVDTAPVLEKALAAQAGLGWIGRNTLLVNRSLGSELLLGEVVTDLPLKPDVPSASGCGTCRACLDACPTGALVAPFHLDARRCIAYRTLEDRGAILPEVGPGTAPYLAGCDLCQLACPYNARAPWRRDPELAPRADLAFLPLATLHRLDEAGWRQLRRGTPLERLSFAMMRRNVAALARRELGTT